MVDVIINTIVGLFSWIWDLLLEVGYWVGSILGTVYMVLYAVTNDRKYVQKVGIILTLWFFLKGFDAVL